MKVLLVNPARYARDSYIVPPIHLLYIAQAIRRTGHEAQIIDIPYLINTQPHSFSHKDDTGIEHVLSHDFDILGIGSVVSSYVYCERLIKRVKEKKGDVPIIIGGSVGLPLKDLWERHAPVDFICESDGELVIEQFMKCYPHDGEGLKKIPGLYYLDVNGKYVGIKPELPLNLDYIPFLTYDEVDLEYFTNNIKAWIKNVLTPEYYNFSESDRFLPLSLSRGCVYKCTFCFHFNNLHRKHSPKYIADYIEFMIKKYNVKAFQIIDDLILINKKWLHEVCDEIIKRNLNVSFFSSGGKPSVVDKEILIKMKKAGFQRISYGVESGSQTILNVMQKQTTVSDNFNAISLMKEVGIPFHVNIVFGMPGETKKTMDETKEFLISLGLNSKNYYAALATPYPGSPMFQWLLDNGTIKDTREYLFNLGGYGDYRLNMTNMPKRVFLNRVVDIAFRVDLAYYLKTKQLLKVLPLVFNKYFFQLYLLVPPEIRQTLRPKTRLNNLKKLIFGRFKS